MLPNPGITHVLYHGGCFDGFTAAWIATLAGVPKENCHPVNYGAQLLPVYPEKSHVLMVDFSLPRKQLIALQDLLASDEGSLTVIDHHHTAQEDLLDLPWTYFDMEESGASLAWKFFYPETVAVPLVEYIRDHDLWLHELADSETVRVYIRSFDMTLDNWSILSNQLIHEQDRVLQEGKAILRAKMTQVEVMAKNATMIKLFGYEVPVANATIYFSDVADRLLQLHPQAPFAAYYMDRGDGVRQWGLRSRTDFDVSIVAKHYGGGGHKQAAGFQHPSPVAKEFLFP